MASQNQISPVTLKAAADLSTKQFYFMKITADNTVNIVAGATDKPFGVLQNKPNAAGAAAAVATEGWLKVVAGGTVNAGDQVGSDANGKAVALVAGTDSTKYVVGTCIIGGGSGAIIECLIDCAAAHRAA